MTACRYHEGMPPVPHRVQRLVRQHRPTIANVQLIALTVTALLAAVWLMTDLGWFEPLTLLMTLAVSIASLVAARLAPPITQPDRLLRRQPRLGAQRGSRVHHTGLPMGHAPAHHR